MVEFYNLFIGKVNFWWWLIFVLILMVVLGPRPKFNPVVNNPNLPERLELLSDYVVEQEAAFDDLIEGAERKVVFANPESPEKTEFVVLYVHGLSSSRQEISPMPERIANALGANAYLERLPGHGRGTAAMSEVTANDWGQEIWNGYKIAKSLGHKIIIIGTSTGASLSTWLVQQPGVSDHVSHLIMLSPNFKVNNPVSYLLSWPWSKTWVPWVIGKERSFEPKNDLQAKYWTTRYAVSVTNEMQGLLDWVNRSDLKSIKTPTLFVYSNQDKVVDSTLTDKHFLNWSEPKSRVQPQVSDPSATNHVIVGDILAPENNDWFEKVVLDFISKY